MNSLFEDFWNTTLEEMKRGYVYDAKCETFTCLVCGEAFLQGRIYEIKDLLFDARKAVESHIMDKHSSVFEFLLGLGKEYTGFTDHQKKLLRYFYEGNSDKEISAELGGSASTVRNYRFSFREKEKQAKVTLAVLELLKEGLRNKQSFVDFHRTVEIVDERFAITEEEYEKILQMCFKKGLDGVLSHFPKKEKKKVVILRHLIKRFETNRQYTEAEVNEILKEAFHDYVTLRRYLIDYGFMDRNSDGSSYWVKL